MPPQTNITSFVLRFVQETSIDATTQPPQTDWHGIIKHVQTNNEQHFMDFADAIAFIAKYIDLDDLPKDNGLEAQDSDPAVPSET